jgi:hypothetical protein
MVTRVLAGEISIQRQKARKRCGHCLIWSRHGLFHKLYFIAKLLISHPFVYILNSQ